MRNGTKESNTKVPLKQTPLKRWIKWGCPLGMKKEYLQFLKGLDVAIKKKKSGT